MRYAWIGARTHNNYHYYYYYDNHRSRLDRGLVVVISARVYNIM